MALQSTIEEASESSGPTPGARPRSEDTGTSTEAQVLCTSSHYKHQPQGWFWLVPDVHHAATKSALASAIIT